MVNLILIACVCPILSGYIVNSKIINKLSYAKKQIVIGLILESIVFYQLNLVLPLKMELLLTFVMQDHYVQA